MKKQSSENKLVITEEFIFDQNKLSKDPNNHFNLPSIFKDKSVISSCCVLTAYYSKDCNKLLMA